MSYHVLSGSSHVSCDSMCFFHLLWPNVLHASIFSICFSFCLGLEKMVHEWESSLVGPFEHEWHLSLVCPFYLGLKSIVGNLIFEIH